MRCWRHLRLDFTGQASMMTSVRDLVPKGTLISVRTARRWELFRPREKKQHVNQTKLQMLVVYLKRYGSMILCSVIFFYMGCGFTLSLLRMDCGDTGSNNIALKSTYDVSNVEYAVLILSGPGNEAKRDTIRATWMKFASNIFVENGENLYSWTGNWAKQNLIKFYFVLGTHGLKQEMLEKLRSENDRSKDLLLLGSFQDSYKNLTTKMLHALRWFSENMKSLKYLIKCDDDSFVRIDLIVRDLEAYAPHMDAPEIRTYISSKENLPSYRGLYWGYFDGRAPVYQRGKYKEQAWFLCDKYLPYALGGGYVISRNIIEYVARNADFLSSYNSEDVSLGLWTASLTGINRVHDIRFDTEWKTRGCNIDMLVRHKQTPSDMFLMFNTLVNSNGEKLCKTETEERKSYVYKWDVLPSECCR